MELKTPNFVKVIDYATSDLRFGDYVEVSYKSEEEIQQAKLLLAKQAADALEKALLENDAFYIRNYPDVSIESRKEFEIEKIPEFMWPEIDDRQYTTVGFEFKIVTEKPFECYVINDEHL